MEKLPSLLQCLHHKYTAVRYMAAKCFGVISQVRTSEVMMFVVEKILPSLGTSEDDVQRQGSAEALASILYCSPEKNYTQQMNIHNIQKFPLGLFQ